MKKENIEAAGVEKESGQTDISITQPKKTAKRNKVIWLALIFLILLGIWIFGIYKDYIKEVHTYEEIDNLAEREGVCFDNLLISVLITIGEVPGPGYEDCRYLCIFSTGDVYCFRWSKGVPWNWYYREHYEFDDVYHELGFDDAVWEQVNNPVYLGRFTNENTRILCNYVNAYDPESKVYYRGGPPAMETGNSDDGQQDSAGNGEKIVWRNYGIRLYWNDQRGEYGEKVDLIENTRMRLNEDGEYEKVIEKKSLDENAVAAIELFESSWFYDKFVEMCLNGY